MLASPRHDRLARRMREPSADTGDLQSDSDPTPAATQDLAKKWLARPWCGADRGLAWSLLR
jgi:hypothetical protein